MQGLITLPGVSTFHFSDYNQLYAVIIIAAGCCSADLQEKPMA